MHASTGLRPPRPQGPERGIVGFDVTNSTLSVVYNPPRGFGATYTATGPYSEVDLLLISFWSFEGSDDLGDEVRGSGIRLFLGLWLFGSLEDSAGGAHAFSGPFDSLLNFAPAGG